MGARRFNNVSFKSFSQREGTEEVNKENGKQIDKRVKKRGNEV